jgi:hypothetical protein
MQPVLLVPQRRKALLDAVVEIRAVARHTVDANAIRTFSKMDLGNGFDFWNTIPTRRRRSTTSVCRT